MAVNYETICNNDLMNTIGVDYITYYHAKRQCFVVGDILSANSKYFVETPYRETCQRLAWKYFRAMMNDEERALADSFGASHGFFDFMHETGLISIFDAAMERATVQIFEHWESENDLTIDWENIVID